MYLGGLLLDIAIAGLGFIAGMLIMGIAACNGKEQAVNDAYKLGYEMGKKEGEKNGC